MSGFQWLSMKDVRAFHGLVQKCGTIYQRASKTPLMLTPSKLRSRGISGILFPLIKQQEAMESFAFPNDLIDENLVAADGFMLF